MIEGTTVLLRLVRQLALVHCVLMVHVPANRLKCLRPGLQQAMDGAKELRRQIRPRISCNQCLKWLLIWSCSRQRQQECQELQVHLDEEQ